jgi:hypothetical protein
MKVDSIDPYAMFLINAQDALRLAFLLQKCNTQVSTIGSTIVYKYIYFTYNCINLIKCV